MNQKFFTLIIATLFCLLGSSVQGAGESKINWSHDYEAALNESKASGKPMLLFFTGTGWCSYCTKLEREAFNTAEFAKAAGNQYIFVKLEYSPSSSPVLKSHYQQHSDLLDRYQIKAYPTVKIVDSKEHVIMTTGYRPGGGERYAAHLLGTYAKSSL